ncbi:MAG: NACHT domain-containing protein [Bryobacteraceae bacterium]
MIFVTPHKISKEKEHPWAEEIRKHFGYELQVMSREDIIALLQIPENTWMCRTHLRILVPYQSPIEDTLRLVREAALEDAELWATHSRLRDKPVIELTAVIGSKSTSQPRESISVSEFRGWLNQGRKIVLEAPAGRGKTTTLIELARVRTERGAFILIDLPLWVESGLSVVQFISQLAAFQSRGIDGASLTRAFQEEPPQLLLNGWNEINSVHSDKAFLMLRSLIRSYPGAGIIVATRAHQLTPMLPDGIRVELLPLSSDQRQEYLIRAMGTTRGQELNAQLRSDPILRALTTTPFILAAVTTLVKSGQAIPRTRIGLLRAITTLAEQTEEHAHALRGSPLRGSAESYLKGLATYVTKQGGVFIVEAEARKVCTTVSEILLSAGQISALPDPSEVLNALTAHHLLNRATDSIVGYRFAHQQFQEFYAATQLQTELSDCADNPTTERRNAFASQCLNQPAWQEPLYMIAEELAGSVLAETQGSLLIQGALRIDPLFAAELARRIRPQAGSVAAVALDGRIRSLYRAPEHQYRELALACMLATGSPEFADILWPLLTNPDQQVRLGTYRAGREFHLSSLGDDWQHAVSDWPEELRAEFVTELTLHRHQAEVALTFLRTDASLKVQLAALRSLLWIGMATETIQFFEAMSDNQFAAILPDLHIEEIPFAIRTRAIATYKSLLERTSDARARMKIALALEELGDPESPSRLRTELDQLPADVVKELSNHSLKPALEIVRAVDAAWVSQWVVRYIIDGTLWPDHWLSYVDNIDSTVLDPLLERVCTENLHLTPSAGTLAVVKAMATPRVAKRLFDELKGRHDAVWAGTASETDRAIHHQLDRLLGSLSPNIVVDGLFDVLQQTPQPAEMEIIVGLFRWSGSLDQPELRSAIDDEHRERLRSYVLSCVPLVLSRDDFRGEAKGYLSTVIAEIGEASDKDRLMELILADITRTREGRAAQARGERSARARGSPMCWSGWHVQALVRLLHRDSEPLLFTLLMEPEYEIDVAWGLVLIAHNEIPGQRALAVARLGNKARDYRRLGTSPTHEWSAGLDAQRASMFAAAIHDRIEFLWPDRNDAKSTSPPINYRLKELAAALAALSPIRHADRLLEIAELPAQSDGWRRLRLLESLVFAGLRLPTDRTLAIMEPVFEQVRTYGSSNDGSLLIKLLCLLPFTDDPSRGVSHLRARLTEFHIGPYNERSLLMSLARCGDQAGLDLLYEFAANNSPIFQHNAKEWVEALSACQLPGAATILLSFVDPERRRDNLEPIISEYARNAVAARIVDLAREQPAVAKRIYELCSQTTSEQQRLILSSVVAWLGSEEALIAGLSLISDGSPNRLPYELRKGVEELVLEKQPYRNSQSYTLAPKTADRVKKRLFEMLLDPLRYETASHLLAQIEEWRLEYGRPLSEPRHPSFDSGTPWPPVA